MQNRIFLPFIKNTFSLKNHLILRSKVTKILQMIIPVLLCGINFIQQNVILIHTLKFNISDHDLKLKFVLFLNSASIQNEYPDLFYSTYFLNRDCQLKFGKLKMFEESLEIFRENEKFFFI